MASNAETQRDVAAGMTDRNQTTLTAAAANATKVGGATGFADATERDKVVDLANANKVRIGEIETALQRLGLLG